MPTKPDRNYLEIQLMKKDIGTIQEDVSEIKTAVKEGFKSLDKRYVTKDRFNPIERAVYGVAGFILLSVVGAILTFVLVK